jgi:CRP-like cAMP-binding protein
MGKYYKANPWVIPKVPQALKNLFVAHGHMVHLERNSVIAGTLRTVMDFENAPPCSLNDLIYLKSGLMAQAYETYDENKPLAISIVLPDRMVNYASYMGIDNSSEVLFALRKSEILYLSRDEFDRCCSKNIENLITSYCMQCIASDYDAFTCMFTCDAEKRLFFLFRSLIDSFCSADLISAPAEADRFVKIPIKLSYLELSYVMYTTPKTIERLMSKWIKKGYIKNEKDALYISPAIFSELRKFD